MCTFPRLWGTLVRSTSNKRFSVYLHRRRAERKLITSWRISLGDALAAESLVRVHRDAKCVAGRDAPRRLLKLREARVINAPRCCCDGDIVLLTEPEFLLILQRAKSHCGTGNCNQRCIAVIGHRETLRVLHGVCLLYLADSLSRACYQPWRLKCYRGNNNRLTNYASIKSPLWSLRFSECDAPALMCIIRDVSINIYVMLSCNFLLTAGKSTRHPMETALRVDTLVVDGLIFWRVVSLAWRDYAMPLNLVVLSAIFLQSTYFHTRASNNHLVTFRSIHISLDALSGEIGSIRWNPKTKWSNTRLTISWCQLCFY